MPSPLEPCPLDYPAVKSKADRLARQISDPRSPSACSACLGKFAYHLEADWLEHLPRLRAECYALFDASIAVLVVHRTPEELGPLAARLRLNLVQCSAHRLDRRFRLSDPRMYVVNLMDCASDNVRAALRLGSHAFADRATRAGKPFSDKQGRWPARVEQLFPGGARATVEGLLAGCEMYLSNGPLDALSTLLLVARPMALPVLQTNACIQRLVSVLLKMLDPVGSGIALSAPWFLKHRQALDTACRILEVIIGGPGSLPGEGTRLLSGHEASSCGSLLPSSNRWRRTTPCYSA